MLYVSVPNDSQKQRLIGDYNGESSLRTVFFYLILINDVFKFLTMTLAVSRRTLIMKARVLSRVSPSGVCGGYSSTGLGFFGVF